MCYSYAHARERVSATKLSKNLLSCQISPAKKSAINPFSRVKNIGNSKKASFRQRVSVSQAEKEERDDIAIFILDIIFYYISFLGFTYLLLPLVPAACLESVVVDAKVRDF